MIGFVVVPTNRVNRDVFNFDPLNRSSRMPKNVSSNINEHEDNKLSKSSLYPDVAKASSYLLHYYNQ